MGGVRGADRDDPLKAATSSESPRRPRPRRKAQNGLLRESPEGGEERVGDSAEDRARGWTGGSRKEKEETKRPPL